MKKQNIKQVLKKNGYVIYPFKGISMLPLLIQCEDKVHLKVCDSYDLFDVVLFETTKGHYVLHRIVSIKDGKYYIVGDNAIDVAIKSREEILAKMVGYYKKDRYIEVSSDEYQSYLKTILFYDENIREMFLSSPNDFFFKRRLEAYFEVIKSLFYNEIDSSKFNRLTEAEKYSFFKFLLQNKAVHLFGYVVSKKLGSLNQSLDSECVKAFEEAKMRYIRSDIAVKKISECLSNNKIKHIYLKGPEIRNRYPNPFLRVSNDLDIFVPKDEFNFAKQALINDLNAVYYNETDHDESFIIESLHIHVELHYAINDMLEDDLKHLLNDPFVNARKDKEFEYRYHLDKDDELIYNLAHIAKHARNNNFWASMITDSYILFSEKINLNKVKEIRLEKFYFTLKNIVERVFKGKSYSQVEEDFLNFVLNPKNMVMFKFKKKHKSKFSYILSRVFAPYKYVAQVHPNVAKHPWLYPLFQVYRWVSFPFKKGRIKQYQTEIDEYLSINRSEINALINAGLQEYIDKI